METRQMKKTARLPLSLRLGALVAAALPLVACNAGGQLTQPRIRAKGPQAAVYIEGKGIVTSRALKLRCGPGVPTADNRCTGDSNSPRYAGLEAEPATGWTFDHWEVDRANRACFDPARGAAYRYVAVFVPRDADADATDRQVQ
jgi:hypothetical protein